MSRHRALLRTLVSLGITPNHIANGVPMRLSAVMATLRNDWPVPPRFKFDLETYGQRVLLYAHRAGAPELKDVIEQVFRYVFGRSMCDAPPIDAETQRACYVLWLLSIDIREVFPLWIDTEPEDNEHLVWFVHQRLEALRHEAHSMDSPSPEVVGYLRTLKHAVAVMVGAEDPADNGWFKNVNGYRRGCMIVHNAAQPTRGGE